MSSPSINPMDRPPPTTTAIVVATAILAGVTGYFIGQGASIGLFGSWGGGSRNVVQGRACGAKDISEDESEDEDSEEEEGELAMFEGNTEEVKLVLVVRTDLGMGKGERNEHIAIEVPAYGAFSQRKRLYFSFPFRILTRC